MTFKFGDLTLKYKTMNNLEFSKKTAFLLFVTLFLSAFAFGQTTKLPAPKENKLLNGLKLLVWNDPAIEKVTVKLRVHSGAAFDPKDKMGVMALLAESFFPTEQARAFFVEDLEGSLDISSNYDYLQITATGKSSEILSMLETISTAVISTPLTPENFKLIRDARLNRVKELEKNPAYVTDLAVAKRLFGDFPYGRSIEGTTDSLAKIDRADLLYAKERFLTSDNATIAIIGNVKPEYVHRVTRQLFGNWNKSDKKTPATFRQPDEIIKEKQFINFAESKNAEIYQATRSIPRNSKDFLYTHIITDVLSKRLKKAGDVFQAQTFVTNNSYMLFGKYIVGIKIAPEKATQFLQEVKKTNFVREISDAEFAESKDFVISEMAKAINNKNTNSDLWLDADTYRLQSISQQFNSLQTLTLTDANRVLSKIFNNSFVELVVGDANKLKDFVSTNQPE